MFWRRLVGIPRRRLINDFASCLPNSTRKWRRRAHFDSFLQSGTLHSQTMKLATSPQYHWPSVYLSFTRDHSYHVVHIVDAGCGVAVMQNDVWLLHVGVNMGVVVHSRNQHCRFIFLWNVRHECLVLVKRKRWRQLLSITWQHWRWNRAHIRQDLSKKFFDKCNAGEEVVANQVASTPVPWRYHCCHNSFTLIDFVFSFLRWLFTKIHLCV